MSLLKLGNHQIDLIELLLNGEHEQHGQVGPRRESLGRVIANHQSPEIFLGQRNPFVESFGNFLPESVHLASELHVQNAITEVDDVGTRHFSRRYCWINSPEW